MKRGISLFLAVLMLAACFVGSFTVSAAVEWRTSEECIALLKQMEGFIKYPVWDYGQWSVGYGSRVPADDLDRYKRDGITESEADILLRAYVAEFEKTLNSFAAKNSVSLTSNQFDALILFSYNCGSGWTSGTGEFKDAVIRRKTGNEFLCAITAWCSAGGSVQTGLINRRLCEANVYLNGVYSVERPREFCYVLFNAKGGKCSVSTLAFLRGKPIDTLPGATKSGYTFQGWYTSMTDGDRVFALNAALDGKVLFARWMEGNSEDPGYTPFNCTKCDEERKILAPYGIPVYSNPYPEAMITGSLGEGATVSVVRKGTDTAGKEWGELASGGWICFDNTELVEKTAVEPIVVTVTGSSVNIRNGSGTEGTTVLRTVRKGEKVSIIKVVDLNGSFWGKLQSSVEEWICLTYTDYNDVMKSASENEENTEPEEPETPTDKLMGTVTASVLNVRSSPVSGTVLTTLKKGDRVEILEVRQFESGSWGRIESGWISLSYVQLDAPPDPVIPEDPEDPEDPEEPGEPVDPEDPGETGETPDPEEPVEPEDPTEPEQPEEPEEPQPITGTVAVDALNVREAPVNGRVLMTLKRGTAVSVFEVKEAGGDKWGRISNGWICLSCVKLDAELPKSGEETPEPVPEGSETVSVPITGTVTASTLCIRKGPGTNYATVGGLIRGEKVAILEVRDMGSMKWGRIAAGWISMTYVNTQGTGVPPTPGIDSVRYVVTGSAVNVRSGAGTTYPVSRTVHKGDYVMITETKTVSGTPWGKMENGGWICLTYAKRA